MTWSRASNEAFRSRVSASSRRPAARAGPGSATIRRARRPWSTPGPDPAHVLPVARGRSTRERAEPMAETPNRSALVITASDGATAGVREDTSGAQVQARLEALGFTVQRDLVSDDRRAIEVAIVEGAGAHDLVVTTGGTGLTPRDVTPQATQAAIDYEVPGLAEAMRAAGRASTPLADL